MSKTKPLLISATVLALAGAGAWYAWPEIAPRLTALTETSAQAEVQPVQPQAAPAIRVTVAAKREITETLDVTGTILARQEAVVGVDVNGLIVEALNVDTGDRVKKGDVLAQLERASLETQLAQIDASRAQAEANIAQAAAQTKDAEVAVRQAAEALERAEALQKKGVSTEAQLEAAQFASESALARRETAEKAVAAAEAQLGVIDAQRRDAVLKLAKTEVRAPADGLVLARDATLGAVASAGGGGLFRIAIDGDFELAASVAETALPRLVPGMPVAVTLAGIPEPLTGKIRQVSPEIDQKTRLGTVRITLPAHGNVRSGNFARGRIETLRRQGVVIPASALMYRGDEAVVQTVQDGVVKTLPVQVGARAGETVEIVNGLAAGQEVVSRAGTFVADGDRVSPVREEKLGAVTQ
jgi:HlyD family secretion protein